MLKKLIVIAGPTASGKSALAVKLAQKFDGEVVSADSRQVYRGMDIGSGKITKKEMQKIPHYLLNVASPRSTFTVVKYRQLAIAAIKKSKKLINCLFFAEARVFIFPPSLTASLFLPLNQTGVCVKNWKTDNGKTLRYASKN